MSPSAASSGWTHTATLTRDIAGRSEAEGSSVIVAPSSRPRASALRTAKRRIADVEELLNRPTVCDCAVASVGT